MNFKTIPHIVSIANPSNLPSSSEAYPSKVLHSAIRQTNKANPKSTANEQLQHVAQYEDNVWARWHPVSRDQDLREQEGEGEDTCFVVLWEAGEAPQELESVGCLPCENVEQTPDSDRSARVEAVDVAVEGELKDEDWGVWVMEVEYWSVWVWVGLEVGHGVRVGVFGKRFEALTVRAMMVYCVGGLFARVAEISV
jgi:hypothetical protein